MWSNNGVESSCYSQLIIKEGGNITKLIELCQPLTALPFFCQSGHLHDLFYLSQIEPPSIHLSTCDFQSEEYIQITPTIPVRQGRHGYLRVRLWMSEGLKIDQEHCEKKIRGTEVIRIRLLTICSFSRAAQNNLRVTLQFAPHSLFWTQETRPSVSVGSS